MKTHTSKRLNREEMTMMLEMLNISTELIREADEHPYNFASVGNFAVRKTKLEGLYTLTITM